MPVTFPDGSHHDGECAPEALEPLRAFLNTIDVDEGTDALSSPEALSAWLRERGLLRTDGARATQEDLDGALALRAALRAMIAAGTAAPDPEVIETLNATAGRAELGVRFGPGGWSVVACCTPGVPGAFGALLAIAANAQADGTWSRLKLCSCEDCAWAFYDVSRNRSRRWCSMEVCGNRAKVGAYRARHAAS